MQEVLHISTDVRCTQVDHQVIAGNAKECMMTTVSKVIW